MKKRFDVVGKARRRVDGRAKVTGQLRFADDLACEDIDTDPERLVDALERLNRMAAARWMRAQLLARPDTITLLAARTGHADSPSLLAELTDRRIAVREAFESVVR